MPECKTASYAIGDSVQAENGHAMTVEEVYAPAYQYRYRCSWTDQHGTPQHDLFREEQLSKADTKHHAALPSDETKERPPV